MSRTVEVHLWDDLSEIRVKADTTVVVGLDGEWAELDLTSENAKRVREQLRSYIDAGHEPDQVPAPPAVLTPREESIAWWKGCREFARANGYKVSTKGYVSTAVRQEYAALAGPQPHSYRGHLRG